MNSKEMDSLGLEAAMLINSRLKSNRYVVMIMGPGDKPDMSVISQLKPRVIVNMMRELADKLESGDATHYELEI